MPLTPEIKTKINQLWDKFWSNGISTGLNVIEQISYLIFIKWLEDTDNNNQLRSTAASLPYSSVFDGEFTGPGTERVPLGQMKWSHIRQIPDKDAMLEHVAATVFPWLKTLAPNDYPFSAQMADAVFLIPNPLLLEEAIRLLDSISLEIETQLQDVPHLQDTLGDVYQYLLLCFNTSTSNAPPAIPPHLIDLMSELAKPVIGDLVCDPCCCLGDFLVNAGQYILKEYTSPRYFYKDDNGFEKGIQGDLIAYEEVRRRFERQTFTGFSRDNASLRLATMNLMLHGVDRPLTSQVDVLLPGFVKNKKKRDIYTLILTDLPSGIRIDLQTATLASNREDILLIYRIMDLLATGGRAVMLVSTRLMTDTSGEYAELKKSLFQTCEIQGILRLPPGIFPPPANEKGAIMIMRKKKTPGKKPAASAEKKRQEQVWFYDILSDGYSYPPDGAPVKLTINPLPEIAAAFHQRNEKKKTGDPGNEGQGFFVSAEKIAGESYTFDMHHYGAPVSSLSSAVTAAVETIIDAGRLGGLAGSKAAGAIVGALLRPGLGAFLGGAIGAAMGGAVGGRLGKALAGQSGEEILNVHEFIASYYKNVPFTFRQLQADYRHVNKSMDFEQLHQEIWEMLKTPEPVLRQVYFDSRMAIVYPAAYQFLRNKKVESGIYLLYTGETDKSDLQ